MSHELVGSDRCGAPCPGGGRDGLGGKYTGEGSEVLGLQGSVKWFDSQKGYGFITAIDGNEYFVHYSALDGEGYKTIDKDRDVEFEVEFDLENRSRATNVKGIS